jgi:uncharacterized protein YecE (DUF72 family)
VDLYVGTSGYSYKEWKGNFYPEKFSEKAMLGFYAQHFNSCEINATFYRMPNQTTLEKWAQEVPAGFSFCLKLSQRITHQKRLKEAGELVEYFSKTARFLGEKLGPILVQLPPNLKRDDPRLISFLELVPSDLKLAFEFRHDSWATPEVQDILQKRGAALVLSDDEEEPAEGAEAKKPGERELPNIISTADWGYLRLRRCDYNDVEVAEWARRIKAQPWRAAFVYFKHEDDGTGPDLAQRFQKIWAAPG